MTAAEKLRGVLDATGLTQKSLAESLEIDQSYISRMLAGTRVPGRSVAVELERRFGIGVEEWEGER